MAELHSCYPSSPFDKRKHLKAVDRIQRRWDKIKESPPALTPPLVLGGNLDSLLIHIRKVEDDEGEILLFHQWAVPMEKSCHSLSDNGITN